MCSLKMTDSCKPHFKSLNILTLPCLYIFEVAVFVKCNPNLVTKVSDTRRLPTRSQYQNMLRSTACNTALMRKSILGMAPKIFNKIPDTIKNLNTNQFKKKLTCLLIEKCYYNIDEYLNDTNL